MTDIKIKRYADKENLKKLMKYSKNTFANKSEISEINEQFYTKEQINTMLDSVLGGGGIGSGIGGGGTSGDYYTKSEIDTKLTSKANTGDLAIVATTGSYNDLLDKPTSFDVDLSNYYTKSEVYNLLSNYYTKKQIDIMLESAGSDKYGESIMATEAEGGDDVQGGLSFYTAVERAPGYDGTSQMNIVEDSNTVEDE